MIFATDDDDDVRKTPLETNCESVSPNDGQKSGYIRSYLMSDMPPEERAVFEKRDREDPYFNITARDLYWVPRYSFKRSSFYTPKYDPELDPENWGYGEKQTIFKPERRGTLKI